MATIIKSIFFGILFVQWVYGAASEITLEDVAEVKKADDTEGGKPVTLLDESNDHQAAQGQRQKRWYNFYGLPPINPFIYKRDDQPYTGVYGSEDPLVQIHQRLHEISGFVRQPAPPPLPPALPQFPPFYPVFYVPQIGCACTPNSPPTNPNPPEITPSPSPPQDNNETTVNPDVMNRWPDMDDERQNWGFVINDTDSNDTNGGDDNDGARPISFEPIRPNRTLSRPPPPVEHGSVQASVNFQATTTTTTTVPPPRDPTASRLQPPSACDSAILRCCHLPDVTYDCFALQGCQDPSAYGNPCDPGVIIRVIERFQRFYNQRSG